MRVEFSKKVKLAACFVPDCTRQARGSADGSPVCGMHYQRWCKRGCFDLPDKRKGQDGLCRVEGCGTAIRSAYSAYCELHYYRLRRRSPSGLQPRQLTCLQCGTELRLNQSRFCSTRCGSRHGRGTLEIKACVICGSSFRTLGTKQVCSDECRRDAARLCGHKRRLVVRGAEAERFGSTEIFVRDSWCCQLCGLPVKRRVPVGHPESASLDHIIPLKHGGSHTRANVQCTHLRCNIRKQGRARGQLRMFG